jgi:plastocyanin
MKSKLHHPATIVILGLALLMFLVAAAPSPTTQPAQAIHNQVIVPGEDRFTPLSQTIHSGEAVRWINMDTDDHTVVSDDAFNTAGNRGVNILLKGTDNNNGKPGMLVLHFGHPGTFVYYCRFHAHLDEDSQPAAPGPKQGIQDADGNYGTPMMGVITVLP